MAELTNVQVEEAVSIFWKRAGLPTGVDTGIRRSEIAFGLRTAAPFLQLPWDEPTEKECILLWGGVDAHLKRNGSERSLKYCLELFVENRNAAILPKPVDPRREKIIAALKSSRDESYESMSEKMLAIADEVK